MTLRECIANCGKTHKLLTESRVIALGNINRWYGWTKRPYSVLEHSVVGAMILRQRHASENTVRAFLIHDMHETEICADLSTPDKAKYMRSDYHDDVAEFDRRLREEVGVIMFGATLDDVAEIDRLLSVVENHIIRLTPKPMMPDPTPEMLRAVDAAYREANGRCWRELFWEMMSA